AMFLVGTCEEISAKPTKVAAELYRANRIENFDTCSIRLTLNGDVQLFVAYTHACAITVDPVVTIETEKSVIRYVAGRHIEIRTGERIEHLPLYSQPHPYMLRAFQSCIRGGTKSALCASLEMAREHIVAMNVVSETSPVIDVPGEFVEMHTASDHAPLRTIRDITAALQTCTSRKCLLHETGLASWSVPSIEKTIPSNYNHFAGPHPPRVTVTTHTSSTTRRPTTAASH
ncbi:MAG TPA: hypothetical protein VHS31_07230, partial [Tepidisphaeraceae bacterium]|nr:hypothetical protein [Tepidisphaeraceae bacterium]